MNDLKELVIQGTDKYYFTKEKEVYCRHLGKVPVKDNKVTLTLYGVSYSVSLDWLEKYVKCNYYLPEMFYYRLNDITFKDYELRTHKIPWEYVIVFKNPIEYNYNGVIFRLVPMYNGLMVSEKGDILSISKRNMHLNPVKDDKESYLTYRYVDPITKKTISLLRHRAVAMAWVPNDDYVKKPIINHKDGNKQNCHASNLEWISFSDNNKRTAANGLKTDNIDVKVMDYKDNKLYIFGSMTEACKFMGRSRINRIEEFCSEPKLVNGRYQIKLLNDMSDWDFKDLKGEFKVTIKGKTKHYKTLKDVKAELTPNLNEKKGKDDVIRTLKKLYPDVVIDFPESNKLNVDTYQVLDIRSGKIFECETRKDIEKLTGLSKSTIAKYIKLGPEYAFNDFSIRVKSDEPWCDVKYKRYKDSNNVLVKNVKTGEILKFESMRKVSDFLNIDCKKLSKTTGTETVYRNYKVL